MRSPTWGDTVRTKEGASSGVQSGSLAAVCGIRRVETLEQAKQFDCGIGAHLYLIEFGDGTALEVSEAFLEVVEAV